MSAFNPIVAIIDPPDMQSGMPGDALQLSVVIQNQGDHGAVIDVFIDETEQLLSQWCRSIRQRLALDPQQSGEIVFEFMLPASALPGTYDYTIVVDAPEHYPEETPLQYPQQLRVLLPEQTVIKASDPRFFLSPATNSQKPARLSPGAALSVQVRVENRSTLVDRFRLACLDLDEDWFTIRYASNPLAGPGLLADVTSLELNPNTHGFIQLDLHPPIDTLAGVYSPTFRVYSDNQPDLVMLDLVYLDLQADERLTVELEALVDRISHTAGQYKLWLHNPGNVIRQLSFSASSRDEEEVCTYDYEPPEVRLPPGREAQSLLRVAPKHKRRRPLLGGGQVITLQVEMQDAFGYQIPDRLPQATLIWKARPWWQFLLLVLAILGVLGGVGVLIWWLLRPPPPPKIANFSPDSPTYIEGSDRVKLNWQITNPDRLDHLDLTTETDANPVPPVSLKPTDLKNTCPDKPHLLCNQYPTGASAAGKYNFTLKLVPRSGSMTDSKSLTVAITPKPDPTVSSLELGGSDFKAGQAVPLSWKIANVGQLAALKVIATDATGASLETSMFSGAANIRSAADLPEAMRAVCQVDTAGTLSCNRVPVTLPRSGQYKFSLQGTTTKGKPVQSQPTATVTLTAPQLRLSASLNSQTSGIVNVKPNEPLTIDWTISGGDGTVKVQVNPGRNSTERSGSFDLGIAPENGLTVIISASDETHPTPQTQSIQFSVNVVKPPSPSPTPSVSPTAPASMPPLPPLSHLRRSERNSGGI